MLLLLLGLQALAVHANSPTNNSIVKGDVEELRSLFDPEVKFYLYTRNNPTLPIELNADNLDQVNRYKNVKFLVHGYRESRHKRYYEDFKKEYLQKEELNFIQVDWSVLASYRYTTAAYNTKIAGGKLGLFIGLLHGSGVPLSNIHVIGFGLGAHAAGFAGKEVKQRQGVQIARVTGLDPSAPLFEGSFIGQAHRLDKDDARIVDVVHTDGGILGFLKPIGTIDYYPNGGVARQPGCYDDGEECDFLPLLLGLSDRVKCSHRRSYVYYLESINQSKFEARACDSYESFESGACDNNIAVPFGAETSIKNGTYYFKTNSRSPFARPLRP